jgi:uncharacterized protein (DUF2336 family)
MSLRDRVLGIGYERAKSLIGGDDRAARRRVAAARGVAPEILYYLAGDAEPEVRREVAKNRATPPHADLLLARDPDESVRAEVAVKIARIVPGISEDARDRAGALILETVETLARDTLIRIRRILAEELKHTDFVPVHVAERLARDDSAEVAAPVLEFSPLLSEDFLVEIIAGGAVGGALAAIARRANLGPRASDAIVARNDTAAITDLLRNQSAQIREETLDALVERAESLPEWHEGLVRRPLLSPRAMRRLSEFVADSLIEVLARREDLDAATAETLREAVRRRLDGAANATFADDATLVDRAKSMAENGALDGESVMRALNAGERPFVIAALAVMSGMQLPAVQKIVSLKSAKGLIALAWKAGLDPEYAIQLQLRLARIAPSAVIGTPMSVADMRWQLDYFAASA